MRPFAGQPAWSPDGTKQGGSTGVRGAAVVAAPRFAGGTQQLAL
jgi:hypothetical protein